MKTSLIILSIILACYSAFITYKYVEVKNQHDEIKGFINLIIEGKLKSIHFFNGVSYRQNKRLK